MPNSEEMVFAIDHPTAPGHFPGHPIIPGAVLLDEVIQAIEIGESLRSWPLGLQSVKFLRPVRPGDRIVIRWSKANNGVIKFECLFPESGDVALTGGVVIGGPET